MAHWSENLHPRDEDGKFRGSGVHLSLAHMTRPQLITELARARRNSDPKAEARIFGELSARAAGTSQPEPASSPPPGPMRRYKVTFRKKNIDGKPIKRDVFTFTLAGSKEEAVANVKRHHDVISVKTVEHHP